MDTNHLTPWPYWDASIRHVVNKYATFCGTWRFISISQESTSSPYPELDDPACTLPSHFTMIHFNINLFSY